MVNTITGLAIPSLDAKLMNRLKLPASVERLPIFGLGCGGGVAGLARAARFAQAMPGGHVLFLTVDLCSLCLRVADPSMAMFVSAALFGDGAAAWSCATPKARTARGAAAASSPWAIISGPTPSTSWAGTSNRTALASCSARNFPRCCARNLVPALRGFLDANSLSLGEFSGFLLHPGGAKVLKTVQQLLGLSDDDLVLPGVLRDFGNMSSPTALFALDRAVQIGRQRPASAGCLRTGLLGLFRRG